MELIAARPTPPVRAALKKAHALVEVTPKSVRLRKARLDPNERKRAFRANESALVNATAS